MYFDVKPQRRGKQMTPRHVVRLQRAVAQKRSGFVPKLENGKKPLGTKPHKKQTRVRNDRLVNFAQPLRPAALRNGGLNAQLLDPQPFALQRPKVRRQPLFPNALA